MTLLLDSHTLLWWLSGARLRADARAAIADADNLVAVSAVSVWEIAIKRANGKLRFDGSLIAHVDGEEFVWWPVTPRHAEHAGGLPRHHGDPFDRMLIAQAQLDGMTIVTRDSSFDAYDVDVLAC